MKLILIILFSIANLIHAKITPPNYDFKFQNIESFFPSKSVDDLLKQKVNLTAFEDIGDQKIYKTIFKTKDYSLDIYLQVKKNIIVDTYIRLPQYFSHDLFLKELQTRYKKQDKFKNKDGSSLYLWFNRDDMDILYQGSCSITCFPMFIEFISKKESGLINFYQKFNQAIFPK